MNTINTHIEASKKPHSGGPRIATEKMQIQTAVCHNVLMIPKHQTDSMSLDVYRVTDSLNTCCSTLKNVQHEISLGGMCLRSLITH